MITAISLLKCYGEMESVPECDKVGFRQAIRVLEAAGKVDWKNVRLMLDKFQEDGTYWPHADRQLRALLEALPEKGE